MKDNKNRPHLLNNLGLKLVALFSAVIVWILINNVNDPVKYMRITNVQVKLLHTSMITDQGEVYTIQDNSDVVPVVTVKARRSIIEDLSRDDIVATADVENMTSLNTVEIKYYSTKYNNEIDDIDGSVDNVMLSIEPKLTDSFALQTETSGSVADGYELDSIVPEQNQIRVSGPESVVSSIASAKATVDVSGATGSISTYSDVKLYNANGGIIDTTNLTMNITSVKVNVLILPLKTVPVEIGVSGTPADGYIRNGIVTADPDTVKLAGKASVLAGIDKISVPASDVDITGSTASYQTTVNLKDYLPDGVSLAEDNFDGTVSITVGIEEAESAQINVGISDISLENVPSGYRAEITSVNDGKKTTSALSDTPTFTIQLTGLSSALDAIRVSDLAPSIDVEKLIRTSGADTTEGVYTAQVQISRPDSVEIDNSITASVEVISQSSAGSSQTAAGGTDHSESDR